MRTNVYSLIGDKIHDLTDREDGMNETGNVKIIRDVKRVEITAEEVIKIDKLRTFISNYI